MTLNQNFLGKLLFHFISAFPMSESDKFDFEELEKLDFHELIENLKEQDILYVTKYIQFLVKNKEQKSRLAKATNILQVFDMENLTYDNCLQLLLSFTHIPICNRLSNLIQEVNQNVEIDWQYEIEQKDQKIKQLEEEIMELKENVLSAYTKQDFLKAIKKQDENQIRKILLKNKLFLEEAIESNYHQTPLIYASTKGYLNIVRILIEFGANIESLDKNKDTPLMMASLYGHIDVVDFLIKNGANINAVDDEGDTALHLAAMNSHVSVIKYLLTNGANSNRKNHIGKTPISYAKGNEILSLFN